MENRNIPLIYLDNDCLSIADDFNNLKKDNLCISKEVMSKEEIYDEFVNYEQSIKNREKKESLNHKRKRENIRSRNFLTDFHETSNNFSGRDYTSFTKNYTSLKFFSDHEINSKSLRLVNKGMSDKGHNNSNKDLNKSVNSFPIKDFDDVLNKNSVSLFANEDLDSHLNQDCPKLIISNFDAKKRDQSNEIFFTKQEAKEKRYLLRLRSKFELMIEAFFIANQFANFNLKELRDEDYPFKVYLLPMNWFERWKNYVNYNYILSEMNYNTFFKASHLLFKKNIRNDGKSYRIIWENTGLNEDFIFNSDKQEKSINSSDLLQFEIKSPNDNIDDLNRIFDSYYETTFLTDNKINFPGHINNDEFIYNNSICYIDRENKNNYFNTNILDNYNQEKDFCIVSEDIWLYFKNIYNGHELLRYFFKIKNSKLIRFFSNLIIFQYRQNIENLSNFINPILPIIDNKKISLDNIKSIELREIKLKTINICNLTFKQDFKLIEKKKIFISRNYTIHDFKIHLTKIFKFFKNIEPRNLRLWVLDAKINLEELEKELIKHLTKNLFIPNNDFNFPGIPLDLFKKTTSFFELDCFINDQIIIVEYIDDKVYKNFIFANKSKKNEYFNKILCSLEDKEENHKNYIENQNLIFNYTYKPNKFSMFNDRYSIIFEHNLRNINENEENNEKPNDQKTNNIQKDENSDFHFAVNNFFLDKYNIEDEMVNKFEDFMNSKDCQDSKFIFKSIYPKFFKKYFIELFHVSERNFDSYYSAVFLQRINKKNYITDLYKQDENGIDIKDISLKDKFINYYKEFILKEKNQIEMNLFDDLIAFKTHLYRVTDIKELKKFSQNNNLWLIDQICENDENDILDKIRKYEREISIKIKEEKQAKNNKDSKIQTSLLLSDQEVKKEKLTYYNPNLKSKTDKI